MLLELRDIETYYGRSHVLHGVSLTVGEGEVVALLGRNGAGKTTTLRSIIGLTPPASGAVAFKGQSLSGLRPHQIARKGIAYVPETRDAFSYLSVEENLAIARNPATRWDMDRIFAWFPALQELRARKGSQLSGGQQQMLVIGRGLLTGPDLLLLDEPSQGLAPVIVNTVLDMLRDLKRERLSVLIVEQSLKLAMALADRVYIMSNGRIAFEGRPKDIEADPSVIDRYIGVNAA